MNAKLIALISVIALVAGGTTAYMFLKDDGPDFGWEYNDCYLDVTDADSVCLKDKPGTSKVLGMNVESTISGNTLYKSIGGGDPVEVSMYRMLEDGEKEDVEIDRDVRYLIELSEDAFVIVYYGKESNSNSYELYNAGYKYDPNCQLSYIVDAETGKMHNITGYTREIIHYGGKEVGDVQYTMAYLGEETDGYKFVQIDHETPTAEGGGYVYDEHGMIVVETYYKIFWFKIVDDELVVTEAGDEVDALAEYKAVSSPFHF